MTLLLAVYAYETEVVDLHELIEMTGAARDGLSASSLSIAAGEEMTLLDLMYSAFIGGAPEAANMIAYTVSGGIDEFIALMNARAVELGARDTNFTNTHGQPAPGQYTTAYDMYLIFREAMTFTLFVEIAGTHIHTTAATNRSDPRRLVGTNPMLNSGSVYHFGYLRAGKTSSSYEGGYSLVSFAEMGELSLICVVLGSDVLPRPDGSMLMRNLSEARRLFDWGFSAFEWRAVLAAGELVGNAPVTHGAGADFVNLRPERPVTLLLESGVSNDAFTRTITLFYDEDDPLIAPVSAGDVIGELRLTRDGVYIDTVRLVANTNIDLHRIEFIRMQVRAVFSSTAFRVIIISLILIVGGYIALVVRYNVLRRRRRQEIAEAKRKIIHDYHKHQVQEQMQDRRQKIHKD